MRGISAKQMIEWMAYDEIEPFGAKKVDYLFASVVATLVNLKRDTKRHPEPFPIEDFRILFGDERVNYKPKLAKQKDWRELKAMGQWLAAMYNAAEDEPKTRRRKKKE